MASIDNELEAQLLEAGNQLLESPSTVDDLLPLLDRIESCLSKVEQSPNKSMQAALAPSQKALVTEQLLSHSDPDVKVSVASCISEITRITAPDAPYDDDQMKEVFQLIVSSFENLDDQSSRSYTKRASILETVAKVRSCVVMLDLECDALIVEMFQHFLKAIRDYHPENVFSSMETIMTLVIEESEDISSELLSPLLASVKNDDEDVLPISRKLGERVIESSAIKLKPHLAHEVETHGIALGDYSKMVASICQETDGDTEKNEVHDDDEDMEDKSTIRESSEEAVQEDKSTIRESSEEAIQEDKENSTAAVSSEQVDPEIDGSSKVVMNNGGAANGEDESSADVNSLKKQEQVEDTEEVKGPTTSSVAEPDSLETEKAVHAKQMPEEVSEGKDNLSTAQPAGSPQADNEEETEALPGHKSGSEDAPDPPREDPDVEGAVPSENEKGSDINISSALEKESTDVAPPSPSGSLPDESLPKKAGRHKKKDTSNKEATPVADDKSKKAIDGTSDSELKSSKRSGKKVSAGGSNENKSPIVVDASVKESGTASDSEVKQKSSKKVSTGNSKENKTSVVVDEPRKESSSTTDSEARQKSAKKVDGSNKTSDESSLKQPEDKKTRARSKGSSRRSSTKPSPMEVDKEILPTPKSKSNKDELPLEETPKTNSKRKRPSEKEKQSGVKEFDESEIIGSKIKVWWPADRAGYSKNFGAKYELGKEVGRGHFGHTCSGRGKKGELKDKPLAVKIISKAKMTTAISIEDVRREVKILKALSGHKHLVKFYDACEDANNVYIIMELCEGGELLDKILSRGGKYAEEDAKFIVVQILSVVAFCHLQGVVHRDLKPENFLFATRDEEADMKLIDFGLSDFIRPDERLNDIVGSAYYVAPEVLHRSYSLEGDIWSIGVITYILLCGSRPFWARTESGIFRAVLRADPSFDDPPWPSMSHEAKDFVKRLLNKDYRKRMTAVQALSHPWLRDDSRLLPLDILIYKLVKSYLLATPFKRAALKSLSKALTEDELIYLRAQFMLLGPDKDQRISLINFKAALQRNSTEAMMESKVVDILNAMEPLAYRKMDFEEFCAAALSTHQLEALEGWEQIASTAFEHFEREGNRVISIEELARELNLGTSAYSILRDWIRNTDGKLSFMGYTKFLHGVTIRSSNTRHH